jgi:hypothetical protein
MTEYNPYRPPLQTAGAVEQAPRSHKADISLALGILSMLAWCLPIVGFPLSATGLVYGLKSPDSSGRATAIVGIVLNTVGLFLSVANGALGAYMAVQRMK